MAQQGPPQEVPPGSPDGQVVNGRYELVSHIARGGMAEVYLARDLLLDRPVALKMLFPELSVDRSFVERFRREAQAAANLSHPNIVSVFDWGEGDRTYYIVMEYVAGRTLSQLIRHGPIDGVEAAGIAADVAGALGFAHRNGVIHRDVKPGNVLIDESGRVKVTDFGIARAAGTSEGLTQTGAVMGTATYFSPEQAQGLAIDARSDVYALGVVLYEMVVGRPPFSGDNPLSIAYQHVREEPVRPRDANPAVPPALEAIILQAMAKDPDARYASAEDLRADLQRFGAGAPVAAAPPLVAAATRVQAAYADAARVQPAAAGAALAAEERRRRTGLYFLILVILLALLAGLLYLLGRNLGVFGKTGPATVTVPTDLIGKPAADAATELTGLGLSSKQVTQPSDATSAGKVLSTDPQAGASVARSSTVTLTVGAGPTPVNVPSVVGQPVDTATSTLRNAGFEVATTSTPSDTVAANAVISQDPVGGSQAAKGSMVTLTVSSGKTPVTIPPEAGKAPADAANDLGNLGLRTRTASEPSDTVPSGQVTRTDPPAGASVPKGSTVVIFVSTGPSQAQVPSVVGDTEAQAKAALSAAGFKVSVTTQTVLDPSQSGLVQAQSPNGGDRATRGSTVAIVVGKAVSTTTTTAATTTTTL